MVLIDEHDTQSRLHGHGELPLDETALLVREGPDELADAWNAVVDAALTQRDVASARHSSSTVLTAAPPEAASRMLDTGRRAFVREPAHAAVLPADSPNEFTAYREWLARPDLLDNGGLVITAFFDPAEVARAAAEALPPGVEYSYDDDLRTLTVMRDGFSTDLSVELLGFLGLMRGVAPEVPAVAAARVAVDYLARATGLLATTRDRWPGADMGFAGSLPLLRIEGVLVGDPIGQAHLAGGELDESREPRIVEALASTFLPRCTCSGPYWTSPVIGRVASRRSFTSRAQETAPATSPVGNEHELIWEFRCSHVRRRPTAAAWEEAGIAERDRFASVERHPQQRMLRFARTSTLLASAVVVHSNQIAALLAFPGLMSGLARRVGFEPRSELTLYAPSTNVLLMTNEWIAGSRAVLGRRLRESAVAGRMMRSGLHLGDDLDALATLRVADVAPLPAVLVDLNTGIRAPRPDQPPP